jgi:hypothetical protein
MNRPKPLKICLGDLKAIKACSLYNKRVGKALSAHIHHQDLDITGINTADPAGLA